MSPAIFRGVLTCVLACGLAGTAGAAEAAQWSHRDKTGDVVASRLGPSGPEFWKVPGDRVTDIVRAVVRHDDTDVTVTVQVRDLRRRDSVTRLELVTPDGEFWATYLYSRDGIELTFASTDPDGAQSCDGQDAQFRPGRDLITMVVPRSCLGDPAWIRTNAELETWRGEGRDSVDRSDQLLGRVAAVTTPRLSPRIPAGD